MAAMTVLLETYSPTLALSSRLSCFPFDLLVFTGPLHWPFSMLVRLSSVALRSKISTLFQLRVRSLEVRLRVKDCLELWRRLSDQ
jgi:hypothetical protein